MKINIDKEGSSLTFSLVGDLNSITAPDLEKAVNDHIRGVTFLVFDFAKLDYVSSAGLRVLLLAQKTMEKQGKMIVKNVNDEILDIFEMTGFNKVLTIE